MSVRTESERSPAGVLARARRVGSGRVNKDRSAQVPHLLPATEVDYAAREADVRSALPRDLAPGQERAALRALRNELARDPAFPAPTRAGDRARAHAAQKRIERREAERRRREMIAWHRQRLAELEAA